MVYPGAGRVRPTISTRSSPSPAILSTGLTATRGASNVPAEEPKQKAEAIIDALPGGKYVPKTALLAAGAGLSMFAISNELYVVNEESVVAFSLLTVFWGIAKYGGPMYKEWAESHISRMKAILNAARQDHTNAVKQRIDNVKELGGVVEITKQLFEVSKV